MTNRPIFAVVAAIIFSVAMPFAAFAKGPVALATSISGKSSPSIEAFSELQSDTRLELAADTELEFVHYPTCQTVIVKGGRLSFSSERYFLKNGRVLSTKRAKCPKTVALAGASQIGGLVLRSSGGARKLKVGPNPTFVLVGKGVDDVAAINVSLNGQTIAEAENPGRAFEWPQDTPPLAKGQAYTVSLKINGVTEPKTFTVVSSGGRTEAITLIRLD